MLCNSMWHVLSNSHSIKLRHGSLGWFKIVTLPSQTLQPAQISKMQGLQLENVPLFIEC